MGEVQSGVVESQMLGIVVEVSLLLVRLVGHALNRRIITN